MYGTAQRYGRLNTSSTLLVAPVTLDSKEEDGICRGAAMQKRQLDIGNTLLIALCKL